MSGGRFALSGCLKISVESCWFFIAKHALQEQHSWELTNNYANLAAKYPEVVDGITRFCLSNDFSTATPDKTVTKYYDKYGKVQNGTRRNISPNCFFTCATIEESM